MGSTPKYGIRWPEQVEGNDVSDDLHNMATDVENGLQNAARLVSQAFTASGTWTKPVGALWVEVEVWGAGAGGSRGGQATGASRGGGGGGEKSTVRIAAARLPATVSVTVGAGGNDGQGVASPTAGGDSAFGVYARARGGLPPALRAYNVNGDTTWVPGLGGGLQPISGQFGTQYVLNDYAGGGDGGYNTSSMYGGGGGAGDNPNGGGPQSGGGTGVTADGGGSAGTPSSPNGGAGVGKTGPSGGGGGGSAAVSTDGTIGGNGGAGGAPGGGGGGAAKGTTTSGVGGVGARGEVRVHVICAGK